MHGVPKKTKTMRKTVTRKAIKTSATRLITAASTHPTYEEADKTTMEKKHHTMTENMTAAI